VNARSDMGQIFERVLRQHANLVKIHDLGTAHRYVTPILAHGGIPDYCLDDFFKNVLSPAVTGKIEFSGDAEDLINEWLAQPSLVAFTDKPVRRFLLYGGAPARDFLQRCLDMAGAEDVDRGDDFGLPQRVVDRFRQWRGRQPRDHWPGRRRQAARLAPPTLHLEPGLATLTLKVPRLVVPLDEGTDSSLSIAIHGIRQSPSMRRLRTSKIGGWCETEPIGHEVDRRPIQDTITVELLNGQRRLRSWSFQCFSREHPFMLFSERSRAVEPALAIREAGCWVAFPRTHELIGGLVREEACELWQDFHVQLLSLLADQDLKLRDGGSEIPIPIRRADGGLASIVGEAQRWPGVTCEGFEVFSAVPDLVVPGLPEDGVVRALTIDSLDHAGPTRSVRMTAGEHSGQTPYRFSLTDQRALGSSAFGRYVLRVRGRLGEDQVFRVCIVRGLRVHLQAKDLVPSAYDDAPIELRIRVASGVEIEAAQPVILVASSAAPTEMRDFTVRTPRDALGATVDVRRTDAGASTVRLTVEVPLVRWAISGLTSGTAPRFAQEPLNVSLSDLEEAANPRLLVRCDLGQECRLVLETDDGHQRPMVMRSGAAACRLAEFLDTWRARGRDSLLRLRVKAGDFDRSANVMQIRNRWSVEGVEVVEETGASQHLLVVGWREDGRARDRMLRIWDLACPWRPPIEVRIPDGVLDVSVEQSVQELPWSLYCFQFVTVDPWSGEQCPPVPPAPSAPNTAQREVGALGAQPEVSPLQPWLREVGLARGCGTPIATAVARYPRGAVLAREDYDALACCFLSWLPDREFESRIIAEVWHLVCVEAGAGAAASHLLQALAGRYQRCRTPDVAERMRRLAVGLNLIQADPAAARHTGLAEDVRELLWEIWEPLGLVSDLNETSDRERFAQRCLRTFGREPLAALLGLDTSDAPLDCAGDAAACLVCRLGTRACTAPPAITYPPNVFGTSEGMRQLLSKSPEEIRALSAAADLVPGGLFHPDEHVRLVLRWLIDDDAPERWRRSLRHDRPGRAARDCEEAAGMLDGVRRKNPTLAALCEAATRRRADLTLENLPLLSACAALLQRLVARGIVSVPRLDELRRLAIRAYRHVPDLYRRDLCLFELSIALLLNTSEAHHGA
jgi:hypothetical protein